MLTRFLLHMTSAAKLLTQNQYRVNVTISKLATAVYNHTLQCLITNCLFGIKMQCLTCTENGITYYSGARQLRNERVNVYISLDL